MHLDSQVISNLHAFNKVPHVKKIMYVTDN